MAEPSGKPSGKGAAGAAGSWIRNHLVLVAFVLVTLVAMTALLAMLNTEFEVEWAGWQEGGFKLRAKPGETLEAMIARELDERPEAAAGLLNRAGYFRLGDAGLIDALRRVPADDPVAGDIRQLLYRLEGPFARNVTFSGADEALMAAIEDLRTASGNGEVAHRLLAALWQQSLRRDGIFEPRALVGRFQRIDVDPETAGMVQVYACPGSSLIGMRADIMMGARIHNAQIEDGTRFLPQMRARQICSSGSIPAERLLAGQPAEFAIPGSSFERIFAASVAEDPGITMRETAFVVYPLHLTSVWSLPE